MLSPGNWLRFMYKAVLKEISTTNVEPRQSSDASPNAFLPYRSPDDDRNEDEVIESENQTAFLIWELKLGSRLVEMDDIEARDLAATLFVEPKMVQELEIIEKQVRDFCNC